MCWSVLIDISISQEEVSELESAVEILVVSDTGIYKNVEFLLFGSIAGCN